MIAAMAANRVIGDSQSNQIPWNIPEEQQRFKEETMGHHLIMGRKTFESIGRPLPGRETIIISNNPRYRVPQCRTAPSPEAAIAHCEAAEKVFIAGGETIYRQSFGLCSQIILTTLAQAAPGDILFPEIPQKDFFLEERRHFDAPAAYTIERYRRR